MPPVKVLDGGAGKYPGETCIDSAAATEVDGATIAAQCCDASDGSAAGCRRSTGSEDDASCIGGYQPPRPYTFAQVEQLCAAAGLGMCQQSCAGYGCGYNQNPVPAARFEPMPCARAVVSFT
jgi:hypothetical protein